MKTNVPLRSDQRMIQHCYQVLDVVAVPFASGRARLFLQESPATLYRRGAWR